MLELFFTFDAPGWNWKNYPDNIISAYQEGGEWHDIVGPPDLSFPSDCRYYWDPSLVIGQMLNSGRLW